MAIVKASECLDLFFRNILNDFSVQALVGNRVQVGHVLAPDAGSLTFPCIIVQLSPGRGGYMAYSGAWQSVEIDVYTFSRDTPTEALRVYEAACEAVQAQRLHSGVTTAQGAPTHATSGYSREIDRPEPGWSEKYKAHVVYGKFQAFSA